MVNSVMIPTPGGKSFLLPVAHIMRLYRRHGGRQAVEVLNASQDLDVTASRTGSRLFLHVANVNRTQAVTAALAVEGMTIKSGAVFEIAASPEYEVLEYNNVLSPVRKDIPADGSWTFPPASVSAVELELGTDGIETSNK